MIWRGSYGASSGARSAMASSARTMSPPRAPRGFRRANEASVSTGAASVCHSRRIAGRSFPAVVSLCSISGSFCDVALLVTDTRIEYTVQQVDHQVQNQHDRGDGQHDGLNHDEIPVYDTVDEQGPHAGHDKDGLDDDHAAEEPGELIPRDRDHGQEGVFQGMTPDDQDFH